MKADISIINLDELAILPPEVDYSNPEINAEGGRLCIGKWESCLEEGRIINHYSGEIIKDKK